MMTAAHEDRLKLVRASRADPALVPINGIDFIDVDPADEGTLFVSFVFNIDTTVDPPLPSAVGSPLSRDQFMVSGGERTRTIAVQKIARIASNQIAVTVMPIGDFSIYTLQIASGTGVPPGFDPMLCAATFLFHVECAKRFDCKRAAVCPPSTQTPPPIDYLAKDYPSFVRVMLDRMTLLAPQWNERHAADLGVAVVEVLAYVADQLSYRHDVVDTEAYLETARLRTSMRRHARLVDYRIGDGSNARVWLALTLSNDLATGVPPGTRCATVFGGALAPDLFATMEMYVAAISAGAEFFEVLSDRFTTDEPPKSAPRALYAVNNVMPLYNWSAAEVCLPIGSTAATLDGYFRLFRGDFVLLAEARGPRTGAGADASPANRHVVRLTQDAEHDYDPLYGITKPITRVVWSQDDALPFPLCLASIADLADGTSFAKDTPITGVSLAYGNVVLADHGRTLGLPLEAKDEKLLPAPADTRFRPQLSQSPLTFAAKNPFLSEQPANPGVTLTSARRASQWEALDTLPVLSLVSTDAHGNQLTWSSQGDLLQATSETTSFVAEVENDGTAFLRFGDNVNGMAASTEMSFAAGYRIGNGTRGNVGRDTIVLIDRSFAGGGYVSSVTNPIAAFGGVDPEVSEHVRQNAPVAFRTQERCVTPQDYSDRAMQMPGVLAAAATFRWTGSWLTMFVTIERDGNLPLDANFKNEVKQYLDLYRMAGVDLEVEDAIRVPLHVAIHVCVAPGYVATDVEAVLLQIFSGGMLADGTLGMFNSGRFVMGNPFYLSPLVAAAQEVDGVQSVRVEAFEREADPSADGLLAGVLIPDRLELFELASDPNYPERGYFELSVDGGL
ncbi:MAG: baseplate J/gp47 family protein [Candidatus Baltobacteraceae bacterium]